MYGFIFSYCCFFFILFAFFFSVLLRFICCCFCLSIVAELHSTKNTYRRTQFSGIFSVYFECRLFYFSWWPIYVARNYHFDGNDRLKRIHWLVLIRKVSHTHTYTRIVSERVFSILMQTKNIRIVWSVFSCSNTHTNYSLLKCMILFRKFH